MRFGYDPLLSIEVRIDAAAHGTWQGAVLTAGAELTFRSELELIQAISELLDRQERSERLLLSPNGSGEEEMG